MTPSRMVLIPRGSAVGVGSRVYCIYRIMVKRILEECVSLPCIRLTRRKYLQIGSNATIWQRLSDLWSVDRVEGALSISLIAAECDR